MLEMQSPVLQVVFVCAVRKVLTEVNGKFWSARSMCHAYVHSVTVLIRLVPTFAGMYVHCMLMCHCKQNLARNQDKDILQCGSDTDIRAQA